MGALTTERVLYGKTLEASTAGVDSFNPEQFKPLPGNVLVETYPAKSVTDGGIILPEDAQEPPPMARVVAVPDDERCMVQPGDVVFIRKHSPIAMPLGGYPRLALVSYTHGPESDIHGYVREAKE